MNQMLRFSLLGSPHILLGERPVTEFATTKAQALLYYLAVTTHAATHSRDTLTALLWGEMADAQARQNLRAVLPNLRRLLGNYLLIERQTVAFDRTSSHWIDVEALRRGLARGPAADLASRQAAVDLYQGEFLSGFYVHNAPAFEAWVLEQREQLHILVVEALFALVREYVQRADYAGALVANCRLLLLEPWSEPAHRQQMVILDQAGERSAALAQYEACRRILLAEFGVEPLADTKALYEQLRAGSRKQRAGDAGPAPEARSVQAVDGPVTTEAAPLGAAAGSEGTSNHAEWPAQGAAHGLPRRIELYGRQVELARLHVWVLEQGCRLVGIFGIGGQGKSALAATFAHTLAEAHEPFGQAQSRGETRVREGTFTRILWRSLVNAPPLDEVLQEWLSVLSVQEAPTVPVSLDQQLALLLEHTRRQRCLLILDNLESVLQSGERSGAYRPGYEGYGQLLRRLAEEQHRSCLLITSRERPQDLLRLDEGTSAVGLLPLAGLPAEAGQQMLQARGLGGALAELGTLVQQYSGNPLGLKLVAETI